jgi:bifunctional non-homologous end joining protein LigD
MGLSLYNKKRHFSDTPEPKGRPHKTTKRRFVIQEHHATRLHWDFRLEMEGVMKSWAVPKGPSMNPNDKHLAVMVEDHPIEYNEFQGEIPAGNYGAGEVRRWDYGTYTPVGSTPIEEQLRKGKLTFTMHGKKLKGEFHMVQTHSTGDDRNWLIFKTRDDYADEDWSMKQILNYGSKFDRYREKKKSKTQPSGALKKLVAASKKKPATRRSGRMTDHALAGQTPKTKRAAASRTKARTTKRRTKA